MTHYKTDIEIARSANLKPIFEIGERLNIPANSLVPYGHTKAKIKLDYIDLSVKREDGKLILVLKRNFSNGGGEGKN